jgi:hypothetical protein
MLSLDSPKTPQAEAACVWSEIARRRYEFARSVDDARAVEALELPGDVLRFFDRHLANAAPERRRLCTQARAGWVGGGLT